MPSVRSIVGQHLYWTTFSPTFQTVEIKEFRVFCCSCLGFTFVAKRRRAQYAAFLGTSNSHVVQVQVLRIVSLILGQYPPIHVQMEYNIKLEPF